MFKTNKIKLIIALVLTSTLVSLVVLFAVFSTTLPGLAAYSPFLPEAKSPHVVELQDGDYYEIRAGFATKKIAGEKQIMLAYNQQIPGPIIKVAEGAAVTIKLVNNTDINTTLHSHGIRTTNKYDGTPGLTQPAIKPGESFEYKLTFPDPGVYWYHPHLREDYTQERGLYGNFLVTPKDENYWSAVNREEVIFIDDILLNRRNKVANFSKNHASHALMGRFGNKMFVDGQEYYRTKAKTGEVIRFYLTNAANTRTFNLEIPGAELKVIGGDNGRYLHEFNAKNLLLSPSERLIVEAYFPNAGTFKLNHKTPERNYELGEIAVTNEKIAQDYSREFKRLRSSQAMAAEVASLRSYFAKKPDRTLVTDVELKSGMGRMGGMNHGMHGGHNSDKVQPIEWEDHMGAMNSMSTSENVIWKLTDKDTGKSNMAVNWTFKKDELVKIRIENPDDTDHPMQHPIHFHGQKFLVLNLDGNPTQNFVWKDSALLPAGSTMEILMPMDNPGKWMAHCHIAEHLEAGMMIGFKVEE
jgi:FtsP/CotA-like multicopper oxidase with cupredoxin domain